MSCFPHWTVSYVRAETGSERMNEWVNMKAMGRDVGHEDPAHLMLWTSAPVAGAESDESSQKIQASTFEINMDNTRDVMYNLINVINIAVSVC